MVQFWKIVNEVIRESDIILEVLDGRFPEESRNPEIEEKIKREEKKIIYVINKCDLVSKKSMEKWKKKIKPSIFISTKMMYGTTMLRTKILEIAKKDKIIVGVVGYPNTGKSSVINALKGKKSAPVSSVSGYTKGLQKIKVDNKIKIIDTPGVIPFREEDELKHALIGTKNFSKIKDPELVAIKIIEIKHDIMQFFFNTKLSEEPETALEEIAIKINLLKKGAVPDTKRAAERIIQEWQTGKIHDQLIEVQPEYHG
jgi:ribosome biogenesis GTPase A